MKGITARHCLHSSFLRVHRAEEHLADLRQRIAAVAQEYQYALFPDHHPDTGDFVIRSRMGKPPVIRIPGEIAVLVGEFSYNLRCALDYLVYALAVLNTNRQPTGTQFPIESSKESFNSRRNTYLKGVSCAHVAMIERCQPYSGCLWAANLRDYNDFDKHNRFVNVRARAPITRSTDPIPGATHIISAPISSSRRETNVYVAVSIDILLGKKSPLAETLEEIKTGVAQTLADFDPDFPQ